MKYEIRWQAATNAKLQAAKCLLDTLFEYDAAGYATPDKLNALSEAIIVYLYLSFIEFLKELNETCQLGMSPHQVSLADFLKRSGIDVHQFPAAVRIRALLADETSWLRHVVISAEAALGQLGSVAQQRVTKAGIENIEPTQQIVTIEQIATCYTTLRQLISDLRESVQEY